MAKNTKKAEPKESAVDAIFNQLVKEQNTVAPGAAVSGEDMFASTKIWIPTGSSILDTIISNNPEVGGWPCGRMIEIFGQEAIGKSTLTFQAMANCQKMGGIPIYFDVEQAGSEDMMKACGVDLKRLIVSGLTSMEEIFQAMEANLTTIINNKAYNNKPVLIVLDSLAQMTTDSEIEADYDHNMNISTMKAKQVGKAYRKIMPFLRKANACLVIINQLRDKPGVMFGDPTTTTSGNATKFAATVRIKLLGKKPVTLPDPIAEAEWQRISNAFDQEMENWKNGGKQGPKPEKPKKQKGDEIIVGYDVVARTEKNKVGPPKREAEFRIQFAQGILEEYAWFDYAIKFGIIQETGKGVYCFVDKSIYETEFSKDEWVMILSDCSIHDTVRKEMVAKMAKKDLVLSSSAVSDEDDEDEKGLDEITKD